MPFFSRRSDAHSVIALRPTFPKEASSLRPTRWGQPSRSLQTLRRWTTTRTVGCRPRQEEKASTKERDIKDHCLMHETIPPGLGVDRVSQHQLDDPGSRHHLPQLTVHVRHGAALSHLTDRNLLPRHGPTKANAHGRVRRAVQTEEVAIRGLVHQHTILISVDGLPKRPGTGLSKEKSNPTRLHDLALCALPL